MATDKKAQRAQRLADGWKDVLVWLDPDAVEALKYVQGQFHGMTISEHLCSALKFRHQTMTGQKTIPALVSELLERVTALERDAELRDSRITGLELSMEEMEEAGPSPRPAAGGVKAAKPRRPQTRTDRQAIVDGMVRACRELGAWPNVASVYRVLQQDGVEVHARLAGFHAFVNGRRDEIMAAAGLEG